MERKVLSVRAAEDLKGQSERCAEVPRPNLCMLRSAEIPHWPPNCKCAKQSPERLANKAGKGQTEISCWKTDLSGEICDFTAFLTKCILCLTCQSALLIWNIKEESLMLAEHPEIWVFRSTVAMICEPKIVKYVFPESSAYRHAVIVKTFRESG